MQVDDVRHDRRTQHSHGDVDALAVEHGDERVQGDVAPVGPDHQHFDGIANADDADEEHDAEFELAVAPEFEQQNKEDANGGDDGGDQQNFGLAPAVEQEARTKEQVKAERGAEKFGQIGGHGGEL